MTIKAGMPRARMASFFFLLLFLSLLPSQELGRAATHPEPADAIPEVPPRVEWFIAKWRDSGGSEIGASQMFLVELCDVLDVPRPDAPHPYSDNNGYVFEKKISLQRVGNVAASGRIDLYKQGCFIWESKQGSAPHRDIPEERRKGTYRRGMAVRGTERWDTLMSKARFQAETHARSLPSEERPPPFILVSDIGYLIECYADFTGSGTYAPFPPSDNRIYLEDLRKKEVRDYLRRVWTDPFSLKPLEPETHAAFAESPQ